MRYETRCAVPASSLNGVCIPSYMLTVTDGRQFFRWSTTRPIGKSPHHESCGALALLRFSQRREVAPAFTQRRHPRELRSEKNDLRRIITPEQEHDQGTRRPIARRYARSSQI